jgi:Trypsin-like peptidase domain
MSEDTATPRELWGVITEDPLQGLPLGAQITFSSDLFRPNAPAGLADVRDWEFFDGAVIGLLFGAYSGCRRLAGSGVMVAPGVALTARHCVTLEEMKEDSEMNAVMDGRAAFICVAISSAGLATWRPRQVTLVENTDLAILTVEGASALPAVLRNATISTRLPKVGERIVIAGHPRHEYEARCKGQLSKLIARRWVE